MCPSKKVPWNKRVMVTLIQLDIYLNRYSSSLTISVTREIVEKDVSDINQR
jgi:hypothetical protein